MQFDFLNPGAKSLALGGAFVAAADDATAGFANPAGLIELFRPEFSAELRTRVSDSDFLQRGRLSGAVQNIGTDTIAGPEFGTSRDTNVGLSYISFVLPSRSRRWTVAGFRHELVRIDQSYFSEGVYQEIPGDFTSFREAPQQGRRRITITNWAASGAFAVNPHVSVGGTLSLQQYSIDSQFTRFDVINFTGPPVLDRITSLDAQKGDGVSVAPAAGVQVCLKRCDDRRTENLRFGAVYRRGGAFDYDTDHTPFELDGTLDEEDVNHLDSTFRVPHVFAVGAAFEIPRPSRRLQLSAEVTRVSHERVTRDFVVHQAPDANSAANFAVSDGTEMHLGFQYSAVTLKWVPKFRAGFWSDPDHSVRYHRVNAVDQLFDERFTTALSKGGRAAHYTGGLGLSISPQFEWNVGADFSAPSTVVSTSIIYRLRQ
jgi:long-chain fatty acid transport protein